MGAAVRQVRDYARGAAAGRDQFARVGEIDVLNTTVGHGGKTYARAIPSYRLSEAVNMPKARHLAVQRRSLPAG